MIHHQDTKTRRTDFRPLKNNDEELASEIVDCVFKVHKNLGPGLLESVYEICLCHELSKKNIHFQKQVSLPIMYDNIKLDSALRMDVLIENTVICELKAVEELLPVHHAQVLSYLRLSNKRLGFLINFNVPTIKDGIKRIIL